MNSQNCVPLQQALNWEKFHVQIIVIQTLEGKRLGVCRLFYKPIARFDTKLGYRRIKDFAEKNIHRSDKKRCGDILDFFMHSFYKQIYVPMLSSKENSINLVHVGK